MAMLPLVLPFAVGRGTALLLPLADCPDIIAKIGWA